MPLFKSIWCEKMAKIDLKNYKQQTTLQTGEVVVPKIILTQIPNNETFETSEIEPKYDAYELSKEDNEYLDTINEAQDTDYEQYVIDSFKEELSLAEEQIKEQLALQDEKDGLINDVWHGFKEFTGIGVSKRDIKEAIDKQENAINRLKEAKEKGNFAQVYEEITGHKYDEEKLKQCQEVENTLENILNSENPQDFEKEYIEAQAKYKELSNEYLGTSNELTNVLNNYVDSQDSFIDKAANVAQIGGMGMMIVGGIACFIPGGQVIGAGMIKAGQMLAMAGTFGDNALEAVDLMTNDKSFAEEKEEVKELVKETAIDGALFLAGYGAGSVASKLGGKVLEATGSKALSVATDKITDIGLSLASDAAITGEVDLQGEGLSQLLGVLTGSATARTYGAKINTKLDAFINDKLKLGIGKPEVEISKVKNEEVETPKAKDIEAERIKDVNSDTNKRTIDDSAWVVQGLDNTCACASLINAIGNKPELYYELNDRIFLQEDGTYNVILGREVLPYHSDSDLPESTAKIVYGAWVEKYGEDYDGDFVTQVFSTLFEDSSHKILLKPTTENLAELDFYNNGQHTVLTANKDGHSYTFDGISENGTMLLCDPQNPDSVLEIKPEDFNDWQIVGESYTKPTLLDGSVENKVGANWEKGRLKFLENLANELPEEDYDEFCELYYFDKIDQEVIDFYRYYTTQSSVFKDFCVEKDCYEEINGNKEVSLSKFLVKYNDEPDILREFIGRVKEQNKQQPTAVTKTTVLHSLPSGNSAAEKLLNKIDLHIRAKGLDKKGGISGCHIETSYQPVKDSNSNLLTDKNGKLVKNLTTEIKGRTFVLTPTKNGSSEYVVYDITNAVKNGIATQNIYIEPHRYAEVRNSGVTSVGKKTLCTEEEWKYIKSKLETKGVETDSDGCFYYNDKVWQLYINQGSGSCFPVSRQGKKDLPVLK